MGNLDVVNEVVKLIDALGATADDVASALHNKGVTGFREDMSACPIAVYLKGQGVDAEVTEFYCSIRASHDIIRHAAPIEEFVERFDQGDYPELERLSQ